MSNTFCAPFKCSSLSLVADVFKSSEDLFSRCCISALVIRRVKNALTERVGNLLETENPKPLRKKKEKKSFLDKGFLLGMVGICCREK